MRTVKKREYIVTVETLPKEPEPAYTQRMERLAMAFLNILREGERNARNGNKAVNDKRRLVG